LWRRGKGRGQAPTRKSWRALQSRARRGPRQSQRRAPSHLRWGCAAQGPCETTRSSDESRLWCRALRRINMGGAARPTTSHKGHEAPGVAGPPRLLKPGASGIAGLLEASAARTPLQAGSGPSRTRAGAGFAFGGRKEGPKTIPGRTEQNKTVARNRPGKWGHFWPHRANRKREPNLGDRPGNERSRGRRAFLCFYACRSMA
jgi:hypothetical protein